MTTKPFGLGIGLALVTVLNPAGLGQPLTTELLSVPYETIWSTQADPAELFAFRDSAVDSQGNIYVAGSTNAPPPGDLNFDDIVVRKYAAGGALLWSVTHDVDTIDYSPEIVVLPDDSVAIVGRTESVECDERFCFIADSFLHAARFDPDGNLVWTQLTLPKRLPFMVDAVVDDEGNVVALTNWEVHKFSPEGRLLWSTELGTTFVGIAVTPGEEITVISRDDPIVFRLGPDGEIRAIKTVQTALPVVHPPEVGIGSGISVYQDHKLRLNGIAAVGDLVVVATGDATMALDDDLRTVWELPRGTWAVFGADERVLVFDDDEMRLLSADGDLCATTALKFVDEDVVFSGNGLIDGVNEVGEFLVPGMWNALPLLEDLRVFDAELTNDGTIVLSGVLFDAHDDWHAYLEAGHFIQSLCGG